KAPSVRHTSLLSVQLTMGSTKLWSDFTPNTRRGRGLERLSLAPRNTVRRWGGRPNQIGVTESATHISIIEDTVGHGADAIHVLAHEAGHMLGVIPHSRAFDWNLMYDHLTRHGGLNVAWH